MIISCLEVCATKVILCMNPSNLKSIRSCSMPPWNINLRVWLIIDKDQGSGKDLSWEEKTYKLFGQKYEVSTCLKDYLRYISPFMARQKLTIF